MYGSKRSFMSLLESACLTIVGVGLFAFPVSGLSQTADADPSSAELKTSVKPLNETSVPQNELTGSSQIEASKPADDDPYGIRSLPSEAEGIGVDSFVGEVLETDVLFHDSDNNLVRFSDLLDGKRPVMLSFNYSNCPKLCSVQLENMTLALREVDAQYGFKVGQDFQVVSISIDPHEQSSRARQTKEKFVHLYNRSGGSEGWHFLTGDKPEIGLMTDQCGFRFKYVPAQKLYSHPPVFILLSPQGKIVRYIHGLDYDPNTIRLALVEAAAGKIGSPINILSYGLGCFSFNESTGKYTFQAMALMRIGGLITILGLLIGLIPYWFFRRDNRSSTDNQLEEDSDKPWAGSTA